MTKLNPALFEFAGSGQDEARDHSEHLDELLGYNVADIENALLQSAKCHDPEGSHHTWGQAIHQGNQTWVGLSHQTLQTPYSELKQICDLLDPSPGARVIDLGAGYGRMGLVLGAFYPEVEFLGLEYVPERVEEGRRIIQKYQQNNSQLEVQDLADPAFILPDAEIYFLYDYGTVTHIRRTLSQLEEKSETLNFKVVARGKGCRSLIQYEHLWLSQLYPSIHEEQFSIFSFGL